MSAATGELFTETCKKCRGKGVRFFGRPVVVTPCLACEGRGTRDFRQPAEKRAELNAKAKIRKAKKLEIAIADFKSENPGIWLWMDTAEMEFAGKMKAALLHWGNLTERQFAASARASRGNYIKAKLI